MSTQIPKRWQAAGAHASFLAFLLLAGCVGITRPPDNFQSPTGTVLAEVGFRSQMCVGTFRATLDGNDVTQSFNPQPPATSLPQATFTGLAPGSHTLTVSAETLQYWILFPLCGADSDTVNFTVAGPPQLKLNFSPAVPPTVNAGSSTSVVVTASVAPSGATTVTLSSNSNRATVPASVTIPAQMLSSPPVLITGQVGGNATITATAPGFQSGSVTVNVRPVLSNLNPASGAPGAGVTVSGGGFDSSASVGFANQAASTNFVSSGQLTTTVPAIAAGQKNVTVTVNGQTGAALPFTVTATAATTTLFRATNDRIEIIQFTQSTPFSSSTFQLLGSVSTAFSPGMLSVGLCRDGARLAWAGAANVKLFNIGGTPTTPTLTLFTETSPPTGLTGVGTGCVFLPTVLVRGTDTGGENLDPSNLTAKFGGFSGASSSIGVAMAASSPRVWRSYTAGLEEYNMSTPSAPNRVANVITNMTGSSTGTALAWLSPGTTLIRATNMGIDVISVTGAAPSRLGFNNSGGGSSTGVGVSVMGTRVVRGTNVGIEVYDASTPGTPIRCAFNNSAGSSATGVGVVAVGTVAFRATNVSIEAYDISSALTTCPSPPSGTIIPAPVQLQQGLGTSTTGVAVVGR